MDYGFFTGDDGEHTRGATPFLVVKVKPSMMIWSMPMQSCGGPGSDQGNERVVEQTWLRASHVSFRDAVIRELKERFGVRAIAQAAPKYGSASAGMVENAIKQVNEKVRTLVIAIRGLHGVVVDPGSCCAGLVCTLCRSDYFPYFERRRWAHCIPTCTSACVSSTSHACSLGRKHLVLGSEREEGSDHRQVFRRYLLGHQGRF